MSDTEPVGPPAEAAASPKHGGRTTRLLGIAVVALLIAGIGTGAWSHLR